MDHIACDKCSYERSYPHRNYDYHMPDGNHVYVIVGRGWCHSCEQIVETEYLPALDQIEKELRYIAGYSKEAVTPASIAASIKVRREWENRKALALIRKSPPRCLECGSTNIEVQTSDANGLLLHPRCGGHLRMLESTNVDLSERVLLDHEGIRFRRCGFENSRQ
jgi:hypothetical protein